MSDHDIARAEAYEDWRAAEDEKWSMYRAEVEALTARAEKAEAALSKAKADREHYRALWESEHCPTCFGPCAGCDALDDPDDTPFPDHDGWM